MTDTTTTRIDDPVLWRAGDVLHVESEHGTLTGPLHEKDGLLLDALGCAVRYSNGALDYLLTNYARAAYVTREVPALPTEPNALIADVETSTGLPRLPLGQYDAEWERWRLYDGGGAHYCSVQADKITAYTPVTLVPGERVTR